MFCPEYTCESGKGFTERETTTRIAKRDDAILN